MNNVSEVELQQKNEKTVIFSNALISHFKTKFISKNEACRRLAPLLKVHPKTIMMISNGGYAGKRLQKRIEALYNELVLEQEPDTPQLWVKVIFDTPEQKEYALSLPMDERRRRVLGDYQSVNNENLINS